MSHPAERTLPPENSRRPQDTLADTPTGQNTSACLTAEEAFHAKLRELRSLKVFSWNLWFGGREIDDAAAKQAAVLNAQDADIVLLQECFGTAGMRLGRTAGMTVAQQDFNCAVLSAAPVRLLPTETAPFATAALVQTRMGDVLAWSVHLASADYGPYRAGDFPEAAEDVFAQAGEQQRTVQAEHVLAETHRLLEELGDAPVVIAGDFNVPSSLDWNGEHSPAAQWPAPQRFMGDGFTDAFRAVHPDPGASPGLTWSQIELRETEPRDRIDFIYVKGLEVVEADHLGGAADSADTREDAGFTEYGGICRHIPDHRNNAFPSDHLAVRATLRHPGT
ncbi:endonuclease/exonuclease/phosphatase family protein [Nesterenkonia muleiensis]|uniref:endonuclease/exonuclease/phosphatase family protein n=1 Tax=Nesterenkonia muleiensis TaxID=2282648 RepID=UPI000E71968F|nr:endonuclease/exonuclease/phosphatase family protein [Nesterenkonia muleiensis]